MSSFLITTGIIIVIVLLAIVFPCLLYVSLRLTIESFRDQEWPQFFLALLGLLFLIGTTFLITGLMMKRGKQKQYQPEQVGCIMYLDNLRE